MILTFLSKKFDINQQEIQIDPYEKENVKQNADFIIEAKYKNDTERASILKEYSDSVSSSGKKKLFGGTRFNKLDAPAKNKSKMTLKSFNDWSKNKFVQEAFAEAFSGKY